MPRRAKRSQVFLRRVRRRLWRESTLHVPSGTLVADPDAQPTRYHVIAYDHETVEERQIASPDELMDLIGKRRMLWLNVEGLKDVAGIRQVGYLFKLHSLALEDALNTRQRPKVEQYDAHLFVVARMPERAERLETDQLSVFIGENFVVTIQARHGDCFESLRDRIRRKQGRTRSLGPDYLAYALLDSVVDSYFPILEDLGDKLDALEEELIDRPGRSAMGRLVVLKQDLVTLRRAAWPMREALNFMIREDSPQISGDIKIFLRDCYDHTIQIIDLVETDRELGSDLMDLYMSSISYRMNEVMRVLTIIATIFIPLTFVAGVYGMNFHGGEPGGPAPTNMPELYWRYGYAGFWFVCGLITLAMILAFWRKGWLGGGKS